jgi:hypothetical protein
MVMGITKLTYFILFLGNQQWTDKRQPSANSGTSQSRLHIQWTGPVQDLDTASWQAWHYNSSQRLT